MTDTTPSDPYMKAKRLTMVASGFLILAVLTQMHGALPWLQIEIEKPEHIQFLFLFVTFYGVIQMWVQWYLQPYAIQKNPINLWEFRGSAVFVYVAVGFFLSSYMQPHLCGPDGCPWRFWLAYSAVSAVLFILATYASFKLSDYSFDNFKRTENKLFDELTKQEWVLHYAPEDNVASRKITFDPSGQILPDDTDNKYNEHRWRIRNKHLEILNAHNQVHSRFDYKGCDGCFEHTNDRDTLSLKSQILKKQDKAA